MHSVINLVTKYWFTIYVIKYFLNAVHAATKWIKYRIRVAYGKLKLIRGNIFKKLKRDKRNIKEYSFLSWVCYMTLICKTNLDMLLLYLKH